MLAFLGLLVAVLSGGVFADDCAQSFRQVARLSKSKYCKGIHCTKALWLSQNEHHLAKASSSDFLKFISLQGHVVGKLARKAFGEGELIHEDYRHLKGALKHTQRALDSGVKYLFEAAFEYDGILVRVDILKMLGPKEVELVEVKATNSVKEKHYDDVAIQKYVLENLGFKVKSHLMHLNRRYLRRGELDVDQLFVLQPLDELIEGRYREVRGNVKFMREQLQRKTAPEEAIGSKCKNPYPCEFKEHCWREVDKGSIHSLSRITDEQRCQLVRHGIHKLTDIPEEYKLSVPQKIQIWAAKNHLPVVSVREIREHLAGLEWPLYFLDFESVSYAIPPYNNTRPYQHLPFSYSLHVQEHPGGELKHLEFFHTEKKDPRALLAQHLLRDIPAEGSGSVVVYHAAFERGVLQRLADIFPDWGEGLSRIASRLWDLEIPFAKRWYYHEDFAGRSSLKKVLPVFAPHLSYDNLAIQKGDVAQYRYMQMLAAEEGSKVRENILSDLSLYGERDTLAMVEILKKLTEIVSP